MFGSARIKRERDQSDVLNVVLAGVDLLLE
jgi:hypothetical protein